MRRRSSAELSSQYPDEILLALREFYELVENVPAQPNSSVSEGQTECLRKKKHHVESSRHCFLRKSSTAIGNRRSVCSHKREESTAMTHVHMFIAQRSDCPPVQMLLSAAFVAVPPSLYVGHQGSFTRDGWLLSGQQPQDSANISPRNEHFSLLCFRDLCETHISTRLFEIGKTLIRSTRTVGGKTSLARHNSNSAAA